MWRLFKSIAVLFIVTHARKKYYLNDNEKNSVTLTCEDSNANTAELIAAHGLYLIHWMYQPIDSRDNRIATDANGKKVEQKKIVEVRPDPADPKNMNDDEARYSVNQADGSLTITKADGNLNIEDQAVFHCRVSVGAEGEVDVIDGEETILGVVKLPDEDNIRPILIDPLPSVVDDKEFVYENKYRGNLATCQSGHASLQPYIRWEVYHKGEAQPFVTVTASNEANPISTDLSIIHDDDESDKLHAVELPLTLYENKQRVDGLTGEFHDTYYKCIVRYDKAGEDGQLEPLELGTRFPEGSDLVKVIHAVSDVKVLYNGVETTDYIDLTYDFGEFSCLSDGYDPAADNEVVGPDNVEIEAELKNIRENNLKDKTIPVECKAKNGRNGDQWVTSSHSFSTKYIGEVTVEPPTAGIRSKDPMTFDFTVVSSDDPEIQVYKVNALSDGFDLESPEGVEAAIAALENNKCKSCKPTCSVGKCQFAGAPSDYYVLVTIPGTNIQKLQPIAQPTTQRRTGKAQINTEPPVEGKWSADELGQPVDVSRVRVFQNTNADGVTFLEISSRTEDDGQDYPTTLTEGGKIGKQVQKPAGGQYLVCYDLGDLDNDITRANQKDNFMDAADLIHHSQETMCKFYDIPPASAGLWWLWIIIIIILLIVIAAIVWWIKQKQQNAGADDEEDPKLEATQEMAAQNANDEFAVEQETPQEDTPMINKDEQSSA